MTKTILIADDHPIFRRGLFEIIKESDDFHVIAEAEDGEQALHELRLNQPDIAILDISMPKINGLDVLAKTNHWTQRPLFVFLTMHNDSACLHRALEFGALGYILKNTTESEVIACLSDVSLGKHYISPGVSGCLAESSLLRENPMDQLTPTERKIFLLLAEYKTNNDIAELLGTSVRTVEKHRANICNKLSLHGHCALTQLANEWCRKS